MHKTPLFSTYRQGENRVTGSMLAVFERIDMALVERLLGAASGESELQMVDFKNQDAGDKSVPDASISADFRYLFEVKTTYEAVDETQLRNHLTSLAGHGCEHLFVLTPDVDEPRAVVELREDGAPVSWSSFARLSEAIRDTLSASDIMLLEHDELLLRELARLFKEDGLLRPPPDVAIVSSGRGDAYGFYTKYSLYVCQTNRSFRSHTAYLGFYGRFDGQKQIRREFPSVRWQRNNVVVSPETASEFVESGDPNVRDVGRALLSAIENGHFGGDPEFQVFLLSRPDDKATLELPREIEHRKKDSWMPFGGHRLYWSVALSEAPETTDDLWVTATTA